MTDKDLTAFESLIRAERAADDARRYHESEARGAERVRDEIRRQLAALMGNAEVGLVNGREVLRKTTSEQFAWARFAKENPGIAAEYTVKKLVDEIDKQRLHDELPDLYAQYCTTRWTNNSEVL